MNKRFCSCIIAQLCAVVFLFSCMPPQKPVSTYADGLFRSSPESQGMHTEGILRFIEQAQKHEVELHSFMLIRHGKVVAEGYWHPYKPSLNHIMHSASKTFTATAIGFAVDEKLLAVDDKVISFFPDDFPEIISPNLEALTIKHLLTMSAGHKQAPVYNVTDDNWAKRFLAEAIVNEPGTVFQYSSYASYMLSAILQKKTGQTVNDYLTPRLFVPLGIQNIQWESNKEGITVGGWGLRIKIADLAKLGLFYLQKGKWDDKQLLSESWFTEATTPHIYQQPDKTAEEIANDEGAQGYGYQLWNCTHGAYRIDGAYGQYSVVLPGQDAVITVTARASDAHLILRLMWENLLTVMEAKSIDVDLEQNDQLTSTLSSLKLADPFRTAEDLVFPKGETRSYQIESNGLGISQMDFRFADNGDCTLSLTKAGITYDFTFGSDSWVYGKTERPGPYFSSPRRNPEGLSPFDVACYGSWTKQDLLQLRLLYITDIQDETYSCGFSKDRVTIEVSNSMESADKLVHLTGRLQQ